MAVDILDPGPGGDYPHLPRNLDGTLNTDLVSVGVERDKHPVTGALIYKRIMPHLADGRPVTDIAPLPEGQTADDFLPRQYWNGEAL